MIKLFRRLGRLSSAAWELWRESAVDGDAYPFPEHGWLCFHCGERYTSEVAARVHFGERPTSVVGCKIDETDYRSMERRLAATLQHNQRLISHNLSHKKVCPGQ